MPSIPQSRRHAHCTRNLLESLETRVLLSGSPFDAHNNNSDLASHFNLGTWSGSDAASIIAAAISDAAPQEQAVLPTADTQPFDDTVTDSTLPLTVDDSQPIDLASAKPLSAPNNLSAVANNTTVALKWNDTSGSETGFKIYRSTDSTNFAYVGLVGTDVETWTDTSNAPATNYWYRVDAYDATGTKPSAVLKVTTPENTAAPTPPAAPSALTATAGASSIALKWTDNATDESAFRIYRSTDGVNFSVAIALNANVVSWTDTGVVAGTTYYYRVSDYNSYGESAASNTASAALASQPSAPANLVASTTSSSIALTWSDTSSNESGMRVYRSTNGSTYSVVATLGANSTTWTDTAVTSGSTYWYRVSAYNSAGEAATAIISATANASLVTAPAAPTSLSATTTTNSVALTWSDNANNESAFRIYRSTNGSNYSIVATLAANSTNWTDTGLSASTTYWYMVTDYNGTGESGASSTTATTSALVVAPSAPTNLAATTTTTSVALTWNLAATNEAGVRIYRSTDSTNFTAVASLGANTVNWTDTSVASSSTYWYKVGAYNSAGENATAAISATTPALVVAPAAPTNLAATATTNSVALAWSDNANNESAFRIYRSTNGSNYTIVATLATNTTAWTDTGLSASTKYWYMVTDYNGVGESGASSTTATTSALVVAPSSPTNLAATTTTSSVALTWSLAATNEAGVRVYRSTDSTNFTVVASLGVNTVNWTDTSVASNSTYWYKVGAYNSAGENATAAISATTPALVVAPAAPTNLAASATTNSVALTWSDNANNESAFRIYRSTSGGSYSIVATLAANTTNWTDSTVSPSTNYAYMVTNYNGVGESGASSTSVTTPALVLAPSAPTNLAASTTTNSVALTWSLAATNESGVRVYRSTDSTNFSLVTTLGANTTNWTDSTVSPSSTYWYKVSAYNSAGENASTAIIAATPALVIAPSAPANLAATTTTNSVALTWSLAATNESGVRVYRSTDSTNFSLVTTLGVNTTSWTDSTVAASSTYWYKVSAYNSAGENASTAISAATQSLATSPAAPSNLAATTTSSTVALTWTDNANNESAFRIYRSTNGSNYSIVATLAANTTNWTDTGLTAGTTYYYMVTDYNGVGESGTSKTTATTQTLVAAPSSPTNLAATTTTSSVALTWSLAATNETGVRVYRSTDSTNFTVVASLGANTTAWTDTAVSSSSTYWYKVGAYNATGENATAAISATTQTVVATSPNAPTNLSATVTTTTVSLAWTDTANNESAFRVYRSTNGSNYSIVATLAANTTNWTDTGLNAGTTYWYMVTDYNGTGESGAATKSVTTQAVTNGAFTIQNMTSFNELVINGTTGNDTILVSQSGGTLSINLNGSITTYAATFGDIKIYGSSGNDSLTVDASVNIAALIYGGDGTDNIRALGSGKMTIVDLDSSVNTVTGNGINTSFWVNTGDTVNASATEIANGSVNRVSGFYQGVSRTLNGPNLTDPTDSGATIRLANSSFWGTGPTKDDVNQTGIADCYYLAGLSSMAYTMPQKLVNMGVDLGDGTYAVRYIRNNVTTFVRVDGDLSAGGAAYGLKNSTPGANGNQWEPLFEKAYAFFRSGANTYASLTIGSSSTALRDAGLNATAVTTAGMSQTTLANLIQNALNAGKPILGNTVASVSNAPLVSNHSYVVIGISYDSSGQLMLTLRNPWGNDGFSDGSNFADAIVTVSYTAFIANTTSMSYVV